MHAGAYEAENGSARGGCRVPGSYTDRRRVLRESLVRLGSVATTTALREAAPRAICEACGFSRAMISAVKGSRWVPLVLHSREELDPNAARFRAYLEGGAEIPLASLLAETAMVRRRAGTLVPAALIHTRAFAPIIEVAQSSAYVAAPLVIEGQAIGFVHADRAGQPKPVDDDDRRLIEAFTDELGVLYQRAWWTERLAERRRRADLEIERAAAGLRRIASEAADLGVTVDGLRSGGEAPEATPSPHRPDHRFLTAREWDVLAHVADGATNRVIAHRLTLSEDTVKTHLRHVLRKLGSTSRASAVAWYVEVGRGGAMNGSKASRDLARWDVLDEELTDLRASRTTDELAQRVCALAQRGCFAEAVSLGFLAAGSWSVWCQAGPPELFDVVAGELEAPTDVVDDASITAQATRTGRLVSRELEHDRRHVVVPVPGSEARWLLQLAGRTDLGDLGLELAESFAAALGSTMALVALMQRANEQRVVIARLTNGIGEAAERAIELADTTRPAPDTPVRDPAAAWSPTSSMVDRLSPRQREVLDLMVRGLSNAEIAERLVVTLPTVKSHVRAALRACGAVNRSDAIARLARGDVTAREACERAEASGIASS